MGTTLPSDEASDRNACLPPSRLEHARDVLGAHGGTAEEGGVWHTAAAGLAGAALVGAGKAWRHLKGARGAPACVGKHGKWQQIFNCSHKSFQWLFAAISPTPG